MGRRHHGTVADQVPRVDTRTDPAAWTALPFSTALPALLPLVHAEFALSELGYFHGITRSAHNARLAYEYYVGHAEWFAGADGRRLLRRLAES
ncbi:hypothetical protein [Streptomyces sp. NPDC057253]|uniref:hypothetical protein n=1 Tax=Streptomyces sp. NPDC057253 TaxID=3346069 RepID=UPI0036385C32